MVNEAWITAAELSAKGTVLPLVKRSQNVYDQFRQKPGSGPQCVLADLKEMEVIAVEACNQLRTLAQAFR